VTEAGLAPGKPGAPEPGAREPGAWWLGNFRNASISRQQKKKCKHCGTKLQLKEICLRLGTKLSFSAINGDVVFVRRRFPLYLLFFLNLSW